MEQVSMNDTFENMHTFVQDQEDQMLLIIFLNK
jgi:hypothetical protein